MKKPNFFIIGAPKCGTTAMYEYLKTHPNIYFPTVKEPSYFIEELTDSYHDYRVVSTYELYMKLFSKADDNHAIVGEASTGYLASTTALKSIHEFNNDVKIIAMLRNPIEIAYSLHSEEYFSGNEKIENFQEVWYLQETRMQINEEYNARNKFMLQYAMRAKIGEQVERLFSIFDDSQVKLILFEDFVSSTAKVYEDVLGFLGVPRDGRKQFPKINDSKRPRLQWLNDLMVNKPGNIGKIAKYIKSSLRANSLGIGPIVVDTNKRKHTKEPLQPEFKKVLIKEFQDDIEKLSTILDRDLSHWLN